MLTDAELIRKLDFFEPLDQKIIKNIASLCIVREFATGEAIVRQGEAGLGLYFITGGKAKVEIDKDGNKVIVAELKEGDFLGEFSLIDEKTRSASVICLQDTRCLLLTRDTFSKLLNKHPEIASQMLRTLVGRIRNTNDRVTQAQPTAPPMAAPMPIASTAQPVTEPPASNGTSIGLSAATEQIAAYLPKPEEMMEFYLSTKGKTQGFLNRFVGAIYAMKAMLRFSMAIVGCPVRVLAERPSDEIIEADCNGVKLILFPAGEEQTIRIEAVGSGTVSGTIYRPNLRDSAVEVLHLAGAIQKRDVLRVHLPVGSPMELTAALAAASEDRQCELRQECPNAALAAPPSGFPSDWPSDWPSHWQLREARW